MPVYTGNLMERNKIKNFTSTVGELQKERKGVYKARASIDMGMPGLAGPREGSTHV